MQFRRFCRRLGRYELDRGSCDPARMTGAGISAPRRDRRRDAARLVQKTAVGVNYPHPALVDGTRTDEKTSARGYLSDRVGILERRRLHLERTVPSRRPSGAAGGETRTQFSDPHGHRIYRDCRSAGLGVVARVGVVVARHGIAPAGSREQEKDEKGRSAPHSISL